VTSRTSQPPDVGNPLRDLGPREVTSRSRLGALAGFEVERLTLLHLLEAPTKASRSQLVEVPRVGLLLFRQHPSFARTDPCPDPLRTHGQGNLGFLTQGSEAHVRYEERDLQPERPVRSRPDDHLRPHLFLVQERCPAQLSRKYLNARPEGKLRDGYSHGRYLPMVPDLSQSVPGKFLNVCVVRFLGPSVGILIETQVFLSLIGLRVLLEPAHYLFLIHQHRIPFAVDPSSKLVEGLGVVVFAHSRVQAVIPSMHTTNQVMAVHVPIGHEGATVEAPPIENRNLLVMADHHQVHLRHQGINGFPIPELTPHGDLDGMTGRTTLFWHGLPVLSISGRISTKRMRI